MSITDWKAKLAAIDIVFGSSSARERAEFILGKEASEDEIEQLRTSFRSWHRSDPIGHVGRRCMKCLAARLEEIGCAQENIAEIVRNGTYRDFYNLLPESRRHALPVPASATAEPADGAQQDSFHGMWIACDEAIETTRSALRNGRIDQKFHYLSPDAWEIWKGVIDSGSYHQYDECKHALQELCDQELWSGFFASDGADGVVMLGCGAPSKDIAIIDSMLLHTRQARLHYALVDFSHYMLIWSFRSVDGRLRNLTEGQRERIDFHLVECDFLKLGGAGHLLRRKQQPVAWFILGGTIGNLNEREFFLSVSNDAEPGDLLVVGCETVGHDANGDKKTYLKKKYNTPELKRFIETPLHAVWRDLRQDENLKHALNRIKVDVVDGEHSGYSVVEGTLTVEMSLTVNRRKIALLTSSRYDEEHFKRFALHYAFRHALTVSSPINSDYKLFVFRFEGGAPNEAQ